VKGAEQKVVHLLENHLVFELTNERKGILSKVARMLGCRLAFFVSTLTENMSREILDEI